MLVRNAQLEDVSQIVRLLYETIHRVNAQDYAPEQLNAWAPEIPNEAHWTERLKTHITFVAEAGAIGEILGFVELETNGHIDCFYVHHNYQRCGVGRLLYQRIEAEAKNLLAQGKFLQERVAADKLPYLFVEASITARPFFERQGFHVLNTNRIERNNVTLTNFSMKKVLSKYNSHEER